MRDFHLGGRSAVYGTNGMVATSHPLASLVAIDILKSGGNAVDSAIGAAVLQGLLEPHMTGLGGDCFVLLSPANSDEVIALNGSGRAPKALCADSLREAGHKTMPINAAASVTLPGAVDGFCRLSADYGRLGLDKILAPAIHYMREGIAISPRTAFDWAIAADHLQGRAREFYLKNGKPLQTGDIFTLPKQAEVLELIAKHGRAGFYEGAVAGDMVASLNALGGVQCLDDFAATQCDYTTPICAEYKGIELCEHPPNGQGATAILINNILGHFDMQGYDPLGVERAHVEAEATKLAYDARDRIIADADYTARLDYMVAAETAARLAGVIQMNKAQAGIKTLSEAVHKDTICLSVVDKDQMAVSLIYSVFHSFGSGLASDIYGINFQNRGAGFNLTRGHPNEAGGGKRPMHTIIPAIARRAGRVIMPFGVMGGAYQPCGHSRFLTNLVDYGMDIQTAIDAPRCFAEGAGLAVERGYSPAVRQGLADLGHKITTPIVPIGGAQAVFIDYDKGVLIGGSDPRKDGAAVSY